MGEKFYLKGGDTAPNLEAVLSDATGTPIDLTSAAAEIRIRRPRSTETILREPVTITTPENGSVRYNWDTTDTAKSGRYRLDFVVEYPTGDQETFPNDGFHDLIITQ